MYSLFRTVVSHTMKYGDCMVVINSVLGVSYTIERIMTQFAGFRENAMFIENMRFFLDYQPKISENEGGDIPAPQGDIVFENVSFSYEGQEGKAVENLNFTLHYGERVALVGLNGSGKSTIVKLILHLYEPTEGRILYNGKDIREYNLAAYRALFSAVFQDCRNFSATVAENVLLRRVSQEEREMVEEALKQSGGWEKISGLKKGIDTVLTREFDDEGEVLSGGETQKIQLARVFAENRSVAIMDEPSSALDPIAECRMFENMMRASVGRTVVFISHRLSSAVPADRVLMMKAGKLVEFGTHEELMNLGGCYADMFKKQASNYLSEEVKEDVVD